MANVNDAAALEQKRLQLQDKEKDLNEKQLQFELRMKETQDRFTGDKKQYEAKIKERMEDLMQRETKLTVSPWYSLDGMVGL